VSLRMRRSSIDTTEEVKREEAGSKGEGECCSPGADSGGASTRDRAGAPQEASESAAPTPPSQFICPINMEIMADPVMISTGHTYDRASISRWFAAGNRRCPMRGEQLPTLTLTPNYALRSLIHEWASEHGIELKAPAPSSSHQSITDEGLRSPPCTPPDNLESNVQLAHNEIVWSITTAGMYIASASADGAIMIWDSRSRECVSTLKEHSRPVLALAASGGYLFSGSYDCTVRAWDLKRLKHAKVMSAHDDAVRTLVVCNNTLFSASYDTTICAWDIEHTSKRGSLRGHEGPVRSLAVAGNRVFSGSYDKTVRCWDVDTLREVEGSPLLGHADAVRALVAFNDSLVFSGSDDRTVRAWCVNTLECLAVLKGHTDNVRVLTADSRFVYSGSWDHSICVWDAHTLSLVDRLTGHTEAVLALAAADGTLASGSFDTTLRLWSIEDGFKCIQELRGHEDAIRTLASSGEAIFSGSYDGSLGFWGAHAGVDASAERDSG